MNVRTSGNGLRKADCHRQAIPEQPLGGRFPMVVGGSKARQQDSDPQQIYLRGEALRGDKQERRIGVDVHVVRHAAAQAPLVRELVVLFILP